MFWLKSSVFGNVLDLLVEFTNPKKYTKNLEENAKKYTKNLETIVIKYKKYIQYFVVGLVIFLVLQLSPLNSSIHIEHPLILAADMLNSELGMIS